MEHPVLGGYITGPLTRDTGRPCVSLVVDLRQEEKSVEERFRTCRAPHRRALPLAFPRVPVSQ